MKFYKPVSQMCTKRVAIPVPDDAIGVTVTQELVTEATTGKETFMYNVCYLVPINKGEK